MNMREQFEAWSAGHDYLGGVGLHQGTDGKYSDADLQHAWEAWQAARATTCPGHGRSECVSCCWPKGEGYTAVDMGTAAADGYRDGKANPELQLHHVALALESVRGGPVLTSNQCYDLARALNGIQRDRVKS